ncbi:hypothetical protein niasHT_003732 [Heterodera trifolii]|uniref:Uncharacterized protein n=1 Tax=Heterodera trifolii TaxID=157864 RepID=A0ABD2LUS5_9BILA
MERRVTEPTVAEDGKYPGTKISKCDNPSPNETKKAFFGETEFSGVSEAFGCELPKDQPLAIPWPIPRPLQTVRLFLLPPPPSECLWPSKETDETAQTSTHQRAGQ